ncbi:MAG: hypothetical protein QXP01_08745 [Candidatus Hadarchaeum sp.]
MSRRWIYWITRELGMKIRALVALLFEKVKRFLRPKALTLEENAGSTSVAKRLSCSEEGDHPGGRNAPGEWLELKTNDSSVVLVRYSKSESKRILENLRKFDFSEKAPWHAGLLNPVVVDQLASVLPVVAAGLQAGQLFQVIGPAHLVEGLKDGTYTLMQTAQGSLGTVVSPSSGQIAGQLRFAGVSPAQVFAPVLVWQVLHGIFAVTHLCKINRRLEVMHRKLETLNDRMEAEILGEFRWAVKALRDILAERANTGRFTQDMLIRLASVEKSIGSILERNCILVDLFGKKAGEVKKRRRKDGAVRASSLLREEGHLAVHDMELLVGLVAADLQLEEARLHAVMEHNPIDVQRRVSLISQKVGEYRQLMSKLPSVEAIADHAQKCVKEMGWFQRNIFARGVVREVREVAQMGLRDVNIHKNFLRMTNNLVAGYVFWRDEAGRIQARILPGERDEE